MKKRNESPQELREFLKQEAIETYLHLERYWNDGSPSGFDATVGAPYSPFSDSPSFSLPVHAVDRLQCIQVGDIPYIWAQEILDAGKIPIPLHPDVQQEIIERYDRLDGQVHIHLEVVPLANARTVFPRCENDTPHFVKLHYPHIIGRFTRDLYLFKWLSGLENSRELFSIQKRFPSCFGFLHESSGTFVEGTTGNPGFGILYREFTPRPRRNHHLMVPAFSLFARRALRKDTRPLLIQLLEKQTSPFEAFLRDFIHPILISYTFLVCECGLIPECNAQNILFELDLSSGDTRFILRDLTDVFKDLSLRRELGLHDTFCTYKSIDKKQSKDFFQRRSFAYDFKLGSYLLRPLAKCFSDEMKIPLSRVIGAIREEARAIWSKYGDYFYPPGRWYAYPPETDVGRDSYIELDDPTFR